MGLFGSNYPTALIFTQDMTVYPVVVKETERGFFFAQINGQKYAFMLNERAPYAMRISKAFRYPRILVYMINDSEPINFDDVAKLKMFAKLNPGTVITPEIAAVILREQKDGPDQYDSPKRDDFNFPDGKTLAKLKEKLDADASEVGCKTIDLVEYFGKEQNRDEHRQFAQAVISQFGSKNVMIPPVTFTTTFHNRMVNSPGFFAFMEKLVSQGHRDFNKIGNPIHSANKSWMMLLMIFGGIGAIAIIIAWALLSGQIPTDFGGLGGLGGGLSLEELINQGQQQCPDGPENCPQGILDQLGGSFSGIGDAVGDVVGRATGGAGGGSPPPPPPSGSLTTPPDTTTGGVIGSDGGTALLQQGEN